MKKPKAYRWFVTGTMLGALGMGIGMGISQGNHHGMRKIKRRAANMAKRVSHDAGDMLGNLGESIAHKFM